jgi:hypothetical protein
MTKVQLLTSLNMQIIIRTKHVLSHTTVTDKPEAVGSIQECHGCSGSNSEDWVPCCCCYCWSACYCLVFPEYHSGWYQEAPRYSVSGLHSDHYDREKGNSFILRITFMYVTRHKKVHYFALRCIQTTCAWLCAPTHAAKTWGDCHQCVQIALLTF